MTSDEMFRDTIAKLKADKLELYSALVRLRNLPGTIDAYESMVASVDKTITKFAPYQCERCGGTGKQEAGCWDGKAYAAPAGVCDDCHGSGFLGP